MLNTCILLNGPPNVGKDTLANLLVGVGFSKMEFKARLYKDTADYFIVSLQELIRRATDRVLKDTVWPALYLSVPGGRPKYLTPRQALIHVSENVMKPLHGKTHYGDVAAQACLEQNLTQAAFSDSGFPEEAQPIFDTYQNVFIFHLYRDGCSWGSDSRNYLQGFPNTYRLDLVKDRPGEAIHEILNTLDRAQEAA